MTTAVVVSIGVLVILLGVTVLCWKEVQYLERRYAKLKASRDDFGRACAREAYGGAARAIELSASRIDRRAELAAHLRHLGELARAGHPGLVLIDDDDMEAAAADIASPPQHPSGPEGEAA